MSLSHLLLAALASGDDAKAGELLRALVGSVDATDYTSADLPAGVRTSKHFARVLASGAVVGAVKVAKGQWRCSRAAWHLARDRRPPSGPALALVPPAKSDEQLIELALRASGMRGAR